MHQQGWIGTKRPGLIERVRVRWKALGREYDALARDQGAIPEERAFWPALTARLLSLLYSTVLYSTAPWNSMGSLLHPLRPFLEPFLASWSAIFGLLGTNFQSVVPFWCPFSVASGVILAHLGVSWARFGSSWDLLGSFWVTSK